MALASRNSILTKIRATVGYNPGMPPTDNPKTRNRTGPIAALMVIAVLLLYPLSVGPAHRMAWNGFIRWRTFETGYWPLKQTYDRVPLSRWPLNWYRSRWNGGGLLHTDAGFHSGPPPGWFDPFQD